MEIFKIPATSPFLNTGTVIKPRLGGKDFQYPGDADTNLLFIDVSADKVGLGVNDPQEKLEVLGNLLLSDAATATKNYRFRTTASDLDFDGSGKDLYISVYSGANFTGTQRFYLGFDSGGHYADAFGNWIFHPDIFGANIFDIRPDQTPDLIRGNADGGDVDFTWLGDNDASLFRIDASTDRVGVGVASPLGKFHVDQASTTAAIPTLYLNQADVDQPLFQFNTTIGTGNAIEAVGAKTLTTTHFIMVVIPGGLTRYIPIGTIA